MNSFYFLFVFQYIIFFENIAGNKVPINETSAEKSQTIRNTVLLDLIKEELQKEVWSTDDNCHNQTLAFLEKAQNSNLAGIWLWDTMQLPTGVLYGSRYQLGNFDECLKLPWNPALGTQYCLADVKLVESEPYMEEQFGADSPAKKYISTRTAFARDLTRLTWGVCLPSTCDPDSVANFTRILMDISSLGRAVEDPKITVDSCRQSSEKKQYITGTHIFLIVVMILLTISIAATVIVKDATSKSVVIDAAEAFCLRKNLESLVKQSKEEIKMINPLKVIMATLAVVGHCVMMQNSMAVQNAMDLEKDHTLGFYMHMDVGIAGFFVMSGLLFAKNLLSRDQNILLVLIKRYFRLIGPFALMVFFFGTAWKDAGDGPLWLRETSREQGYCEDNWWLSVLMLNNYVHSDRLCHFVSWYVAADFQLTVVCAGLYLVYRRSACLAKLLFVILATIALAVPAVMSYCYQLKGIFAADVDTLIHYSTSTYFVKFYSKSHTHASAYLTGVLGAYILTVCKPITSKPKVSNKTLDTCLFSLCFINVWAPLFMGALFWNKTFGGNIIAAAIFEGTNRVYYAINFCCIVLFYHYGIVTVGRKLYFWSAWVPLSKLSYGLYLIHPAILLHNIYSARSPASYDVFTMFTMALGAVTFGFLLSLLMYLLVETPLSNLSNLILSSRKKEVSSATSRTNEDDKKTDITLPA